VSGGQFKQALDAHVHRVVQSTRACSVSTSRARSSDDLYHTRRPRG
jgi:hypothetical protein